MKLKNKIKHSFIAVIVFVFGIGLFSEPAIAAATETDVYLKIESFTWKEYDSGSQLLKESGPIYGLGVSSKSDIAKSLTFKAKGELFGGSIDYDGQTQAGTPLKTDTDYFGFKLEGDIGRKFMVAKKFSLEPFAGLGYMWWSRDIQSTDSGTGYEERWSSFYARLGIRRDLIFSDQLKAFVEAGLKLPIYTENKTDWSEFGLGDITVEPGNKASFFAEAGLKWKKFKSSIFYEGMRFSRSDLVTVSGISIYQPESKADIFGANIGMSF